MVQRDLVSLTENRNKAPSPFTIDFYQCPSCPEVVSQTYCRYCGKNIPDDFSFCRYCGRPVAPAEGQQFITYPIRLDADYQEKSKRTELIIRIFYGIVLLIVFYFWSLAAGLAFVVLWLHILVLGRRNRGLWEFILGYQRFAVRMYSYLLCLTDERAPMSGR